MSVNSGHTMAAGFRMAATTGDNHLNHQHSVVWCVQWWWRENGQQTGVYCGVNAENIICAAASAAYSSALPP